MTHAAPEDRTVSHVEAGLGSEHEAHLVGLLLEYATVGQLEADAQELLGYELRDQRSHIGGQKCPHDEHKTDGNDVHDATVADLLGRVLQNGVTHLVRHYDGHLVVVLDKVQQAGEHDQIATGEGCGVHNVGVDHGQLPLDVGHLGYVLVGREEAIGHFQRAIRVRRVYVQYFLLVDNENLQTKELNKFLNV